MSDNKLLLVPFVLGLVALLVGDALLVWPSLRATGMARREMSDYQPMLADLPVQARKVEVLSSELHEIRVQLEGERDSRTVGLVTDEILHELRRDDRGDGGAAPSVRIRSAAGELVGESLSERDRAVTVDAEATFDSIFELIRRVELMSESVRLVRVRIDGPGTDEASDANPLLAASLDLELDGGFRTERGTD